MKAAVIGAGSEALHTIQKAKEEGLFVIALDGNPEAAGLAAADQGLVVDISDEQEIISILQKKQPDFVLTAPIGRYLTTIGAVNDALKLPGISREMALKCTDKYLFHTVLQRQKLRNCKCYAISKQGDFYDRAASGQEDFCGQAVSGQAALRFPAILKPRYGSGSRGIYMVSAGEQLDHALREVTGEDYILEECIAGEEYGVDGAVTEAGFQMILLRKKENTPLPARQAVGYLSVLPDEDEKSVYQRMKIYIRRVVECLGLRDCLFHADIIDGRSGPFVIELSARPSGHNLHNLFTPLSTGVDMAGEYIRYRKGKSYSFCPEETKTMLIHYFDMEGEVKQIPTAEQVQAAVKARLAAWECSLQPGDRLPAVSDGHSVMGRGYFILQGEDENLLAVEAQKVKDLFMHTGV